MSPEPATPALTLPNGQVLQRGRRGADLRQPQSGTLSRLSHLHARPARGAGGAAEGAGGDRRRRRGQLWRARPRTARAGRTSILNEVRDRLDLSRVHFLGKVPYPTFVALMQVSRAHAYLTYPFVLSWSMLEAMAAGAMVVGSRHRPGGGGDPRWRERPAGRFLRCRRAGRAR